MNRDDAIFEEVAGLYRIIPLKVLRRTPGVLFDLVPIDVFPRIDAIDRVIHEPGAISPGPLGEVSRPWYMHADQDDHLIVLHGTRYVDVYTPQHERTERFAITPHRIDKNGQKCYEGAAMLVWPRGVFHRIRSCEKEGSASVNLAVHYPGLDPRANFNVYDLDQETGRCRVIRPGHLDQPRGADD